MGEVMFIARPLMYVLLIKKFGSRSWLPWFASLTIDLLEISSSTTLLIGDKDLQHRLSEPEKDEFGRRKLLLALYLMRDPCFSRYTRQKLVSIEKTLEPVPIVWFITGQFVVGISSDYLGVIDDLLQENLLSKKKLKLAMYPFI